MAWVAMVAAILLVSSLDAATAPAAPLANLTIPAELGYVVETHPPATPGAPTIIHVQEAHTNPEAQQHLIGILQRLIQEHGLKLILVEGGEGDVSLSYLRSYGPLENRKQVAEKYLKLGILSAEEYLDIASDAPLILWGVEQQDLYDRNVQAFLEVESLRERLAPIVASARQAVDALEPRLFDPAVRELDAKVRAFADHQMGLAEHVEFLAGLAARTGVATGDLPHVTRFRAIRHLEESIQPEGVQTEQQAFLRQLKRQVDAASFNEFLARAKAMQEGTVRREVFYAQLEDLAQHAHIALDTYPRLARYLSYVNESAQLKPTLLAGELDQLAERLRQRLLSTPASRQLRLISEQFDLVEKLIELKLSPEEYQRVQELALAGLALHWTNFLTQQLTLQGLPAPDFTRLSELSTALPTLQQFYEAAQARDEALAARAVDKLTQAREPLAVLITGGFHAPEITQRLTDRGVGVVAVVPKVTHTSDDRLYRAVLKYKSGHGSFEDVQAVAASLRPTPADVAQH
ncbi:MAG: hypothetical protein HY596_04630 [Candidatus Omnitrophica bacterium]|nr:hypothetical protein [Candidatus Omnitrophota bacterium]